MKPASLTLILGGARSGKSLLAERLASAGGATVTYIATAQDPGGDTEFAARIAHHRARRPSAWGLVEAPRDLGAAIEAVPVSGPSVVLVDCLTLWLASLLCPLDGTAPLADADALVARLLETLEAREAGGAECMLVSNEIGLGVVPADALSRRYVDELGRLNQAVAARADRVVMTVAGLPCWLKGSALPAASPPPELGPGLTSVRPPQC